MSDGSPAGPRFAPTPVWTVPTDAPLKGLSLAREDGLIFAWDEGDQLYLLNLQGERVAACRAPGRVISAQASDSGSLYVVLGEGGVLWCLGRGLEPIAERPTGIDASTLAIDPHGRYVALASKVGTHAFFNRYGRPAGVFESRQPIAHLGFVADAPLLIAASNFGAIMAFELAPTGSGAKLDAQLAWQQSLLSNVGRLALSGDGRVILASCFTHGVHRFNLEGNIEGAYHLGGSATHAVPDFVGRTIAVATIEGELALLNSVGNVRWQTGLPRPAIALQTDALGRFVIYGLGTGEITRLDLESSPASAAGRPSRAGRVATGPLRSPDWTLPVAQTEEQADFAVLAVLDDPPRIGFMTTRNRLQLFTTEAQALGQASEMSGVGRSLWVAPGYIAAATDRHILLYDARQNGLRKIDLSLVELTHLALRPESFGLALVQERDRIGRATPDGRWIWKRELNAPVEEIALDPNSTLAASLEDGRLLIFDPEGQPTEIPLVNPPESCLLIEAPEGSPETISWLVLARRAQWLKGLDQQGRTRWECRLPFEPWRMQRIGPLALITAPDGRSLAFDGAGKPRGQGRGDDPQAVYTVGPRGVPLRITRQGVNLSCTELSGQMLWRSIVDAPLGPLAAGRSGVAVMIGRSLAWFSSTLP